MSWKDLLQTADELLTLPWIGGQVLRTQDRTFRIEGRLPREHGWHVFRVIKARVLRHERPAEVRDWPPHQAVVGYLVGDRLIRDEVRVATDPAQLVAATERVHLLEPGLARFVRVSASRFYQEGPLIFAFQEMPLGSEESVLQAYLDQKASVDDVPGVSPALDVAFRFESWRRAEAERRRREERERQEREAQQRVQEARLAVLREAMGTGTGRRELATVDFAEAARAALAVGGAEYLDSRDSYNRGEKVVQFRVDRQRFECTCDARTLRLIDAGICLTDHHTGEKGDTRFTLESFPGVIREAIADDKLVVWRHVD